MKKIVMLIVWMVSAMLLHAQSRSRDHQQYAGRQAEKMKMVLSLDDTQYASVKSINEKFADRHQVLRRDSTMQREEKFGEYKALRAEKEKEIDAILTPAQKIKMGDLESRAKRKIAITGE